MLKQLASLLCSLFVPKRDLGGVDSKTVYGLAASSLGVPDYSSYVEIPVAITDKSNSCSTGLYVTPYDCLIIANSNDIASNMGNAQHVSLSINMSGIISCTRRANFNCCTFIFAPKGQSVKYNIQGTENYLKVYKLLPN